MMNDEQVMAKIISLAEAEDHIRAVLMEGSRINPKAKADKWRDFDIVYATTSNSPYVDGQWMQNIFIPTFGDVAVKQIPDNGNVANVYTWLIQFASGLRIDLTFNSLEFLARPNIMESLTGVILDKDANFSNLPLPNESDYLPKVPSQEDFTACCNEFWWVAPYVTKAIAREQLLLALGILNNLVRPEYLKLLTWLAASQTDFKVNLGKQSCYVSDYVDSKYYDPLLASYPQSNLLAIGKSLSALVYAFPSLASQTAKKLGFNYDVDEGQRAMLFLERHYGEFIK